MSWLRRVRRDFFKRDASPVWNPIKRKILGEDGKPLPEPHVRMTELLGDDWTIIGRTFEDLIICGPAVVYAHETDFIDNVFEGPTDSIIWEVDEQRRPKIQGALTVKHCRFVRCRFIGVGLVARKAIAEQLRNDFAKGNEWRV